MSLFYKCLCSYCFLLVLSGQGTSLFVFASLVLGIQYDPINIKTWILIRENMILVIYEQKPRHAAVATFGIKSQRPAGQGQMAEVGKGSSLCTSLATTPQYIGAFRCWWPALSVSGKVSYQFIESPAWSPSGQWWWFTWTYLTYIPLRLPSHCSANYIPRSRMQSVSGPHDSDF